MENSVREEGREGICDQQLRKGKGKGRGERKDEGERIEEKKKKYQRPGKKWQTSVDLKQWFLIL